MRKRILRFAKWFGRAVGCLVLFYSLFILIGAWPINRGFVNANGGVPVYIYSSAVHTDLVVPIENEVWDWSSLVTPAAFNAKADWATHYAIGWGDRGFYLETPTWADLKVSTALNAMLLPSDTVLHVECVLEPMESDRCRLVVLSAEQYRSLCESIQASFGPSDDPRPIADESYHDFDAFYPATGAYHCFYTCNSWAGDRLASAGVSVPMWSPLPGSVFWALPDAPID